MRKYTLCDRTRSRKKNKNFTIAHLTILKRSLRKMIHAKQFSRWWGENNKTNNFTMMQMNELKWERASEKAIYKKRSLWIISDAAPNFRCNFESFSIALVYLSITCATMRLICDENYIINHHSISTLSEAFVLIEPTAYGFMLRSVRSLDMSDEGIREFSMWALSAYIMAA